jgi:arylsulfatase A-like enzyme
VPPGKPSIWHASWRGSWRLAQGERFGREALLGILAYSATLLASECSVPEATTIQFNIIFALADDLNLATARQLPAPGPVLTEKDASFENAFVDYCTRCVAPRATILTSLYSHNRGVRGNVFADGGFEKVRNEGNEKNTIAVHPQESGYQTACSASTSTSTRETVRLTSTHRQPYPETAPPPGGGGAASS